MLNKLSKFAIILALAITAASPSLVYAQADPISGYQTPTIPGITPPNTKPPVPATTKPATTSNTTQSATADLPIYNGGVDQSIRDYLCAPSEESDGLDLVRCINRLYKFGVTAGALLLVFFVVYSGYLYIAGGQGGKEQAKKIIPNTLTGMAIILGSYVLLYFINPNLVAFKPIQPPIFSAEDLPTCSDIGFGKNCVPAGDFYEKTDVAPSSGCMTTFSSESEARTHMETVSVKVWDGRTSKVTKTIGVQVQKCLAQKTKTVFEKIYNSPEKPVIKSIGGFTWRMATGSSTKLSTHSFGLTYDINWEENYYIKGGKTVGKYWKPCPAAGCDPYSLPINGAVVRELKAAGFGWGGEWVSLKDYMHFSCHPKENGKCF